MPAEMPALRVVVVAIAVTAAAEILRFAQNENDSSVGDVQRRWPALQRSLRRGFGGRGFGGLEAVADPGFGEDVFGLGGVGFEFFAELVDDDTEVFGFFAVVGAPDGLQHTAVR